MNEMRLAPRLRNAMGRAVIAELLLGNGRVVIDFYAGARMDAPEIEPAGEPLGSCVVGLATDAAPVVGVITISTIEEGTARGQARMTYGVVRAADGGIAFDGSVGLPGEGAFFELTNVDVRPGDAIRLRSMSLVVPQ